MDYFCQLSADYELTANVCSKRKMWACEYFVAL